MWLGEKITEPRIGNGISLIITSASGAFASGGKGMWDMF